MTGASGMFRLLAVQDCMLMRCTPVSVLKHGLYASYLQ